MSPPVTPELTHYNDQKNYANLSLKARAGIIGEKPR